MSCSGAADAGSVYATADAGARWAKVGTIDCGDCQIERATLRVADASHLLLTGCWPRKSWINEDGGAHWELKPANVIEVGSEGLVWGMTGWLGGSSGENLATGTGGL